jgi:hypothetical protein
MEGIEIRTNVQYIKGLRRVIVIMDAQPGTAEAIELKALFAALKQYELKHFVLPSFESKENKKPERKEAIVY